MPHFAIEFEHPTDAENWIFSGTFYDAGAAETAYLANVAAHPSILWRLVERRKSVWSDYIATYILRSSR